MSCQWASLILVLDSHKVTATTGNSTWLTVIDVPDYGIHSLRASLLATPPGQRIIVCLDDGEDLREDQLASRPDELASCKVLSFAQQKHVTSDAGEMWIDVFRCSLQSVNAGSIASHVLQPLLHEAAAARSRERRLQVRLSGVQQQLLVAQQKMLQQLPSVQLKLGMLSLIEHLRRHAPGASELGVPPPAALPVTEQRFRDSTSTASNNSSQSSSDSEAEAAATAPAAASSPSLSQPASGTVPLSTLELLDSQETAAAAPPPKKVSLLSLVGTASSSGASGTSGTALRNAPKRRRRR